MGSQLMTGVRVSYAIEIDTLPYERRQQELPTLVGRGGFAHWFAPFAHPELPSELARLRDADGESVLAFGHVYGEMGYGTFSDSLDLDWVTQRMKAGQTTAMGDPLPWLRAHAAGISLCLEISEALAKQGGKRFSRQWLDRCDGAIFGHRGSTHRISIEHLDSLHRLRPGSTAPKPIDIARAIRRHIINANVGGITRSVSVNESGADQTFFRYSTPLEVAYWHLANVVDGGTVKRCEADGCGGVFIQTDPRQRYCPKRWRQLESSCATRQRQRKTPRGKARG